MGRDPPRRCIMHRWLWHRWRRFTPTTPSSSTFSLVKEMGKVGHEWSVHSCLSTYPTWDRNGLRSSIALLLPSGLCSTLLSLMLDISIMIDWNLPFIQVENILQCLFDNSLSLIYFGNTENNELGDSELLNPLSIQRRKGTKKRDFSYFIYYFTYFWISNWLNYWRIPSQTISTREDFPFSCISPVMTDLAGIQLTDNNCIISDLLFEKKKRR